MIETVKDTESGSINSPDMAEFGKSRKRAILSAEQSYSVASKLENDNQTRNDLNAVVARKYNGGFPHEPSILVANGEGWRNNAPTGFMSGIVDRIIPAPIQAIDNVRYLTSASLDSADPEAQKKSEFFQKEVTKAIRSWNGWRDFNSALWQENILHGYAAPANLNPYSPWPKMFRGNEIFFPEGTGQYAKTVQVFAVKEDLLLHEFVELVKDGPETSKDAGWEFDECIKVINDALPSSPTDNNNETGDARKWEDAIREGNSGASHSGAKIVQLYHTLAVETDTKKVSHRIVNRRGNHEQLFQKDDRWEDVEDCVTLFTLQPGNGKYYSSKGVGKMLLNGHIAIEKSRNEMLDNLRFAGMMILHTDQQNPTFQLKVVQPFLVTSSNAKLEQQSIQSNVDDYINADNQVSKWMEQLVGSYISGLKGDNPDDPTRTATEANIEAQRDAQAKTAFLTRGLGIESYLISQITRRLCDPETTDQIAKDLQKKLKDSEQGNMNDEEIKELSHAPAAQVVQDLTQMQNQQIVAVYPSLAGNPNIDQDALLAKFLAASVNPKFAQDVQLTKQGQNANDSENLRQALIEREAILAGAPGIPVSPRDNHEIHLKADYADFKAGLPNIINAAPKNPAILDHFGAALVHDRSHIQMMKDAGAKPEDTKDFETAQNAFEQVLHQVGQQLMDQKNAQEASPESATASPARSDAQEGSTQQSESGAPTENEDIHSNPDILLAWIKEFPNLAPNVQNQLLEASGIDTRTQQAPTNMQGMPPNPQGAMPDMQGAAPNLQGRPQNSGYVAKPAPPPMLEASQEDAPATTKNNTETA